MKVFLYIFSVISIVWGMVVSMIGDGPVYWPAVVLFTVGMITATLLVITEKPNKK